MSTQKLDIRKIPNGPYCSNDRGACPYWSETTDEYNVSVGACAFLGIDDNTPKCSGMLWNKLKECKHNKEDYAEDD